MAGIGMVSALGPGSGGAAVFSGAAPGWWEITGRTCIAAYQPKGAANLAASYINLANPGTYNAAPGVAPTHNPAVGWTFTTAQWLNTAYIPASTQSRSIMVRINNGAAGGYQSLAGMLGAGENFHLRVTQTGTHMWGNGQLISGGVPEYTTGVVGISGNQGYYNGTAQGGLIPWAAGNPVAVYLGGNNNGGSFANGWAGDVIAFAIYSDTLTAGEVSALSTRMAAL